MQATITNVLTTPETTRHVYAAWRNRLATWLFSLARRLSEADLASPSKVASGAAPFVPATQRNDVHDWFTSLSPATLAVVCPEPAKLQALVRVANVMKYLPDEPTLLEFARLVPDWHELHKRFSGYLLRRLVSLHHRGRRPDATFEVVHAWLQRRNRCLTATPMQWHSAVWAAEAGVGEEAADFLVHDNRAPARA